jgi:hypothetical protein
MFFAVEPFLLQNECRHAIFEQRQTGIMSPGHDPENVHGDTNLAGDGLKPLRFLLTASPCQY